MLVSRRFKSLQAGEKLTWEFQKTPTTAINPMDSPHSPPNSVTAEWLAAESPPPYTSDPEDLSDPEEAHVSTAAAQYPEFSFIWDSMKDDVLLPSLEGGFEKVCIEEIFEVENIRSLSWYYLLEPQVGTFYKVNEQKTRQAEEPQAPQTSAQTTASQHQSSGINALLQQPIEDSVIDSEIPEVLQCTLCENRTEVRFQECSHSTCTDCLLGIWRGRRENRKHFPTSFPCPFCRAEIRKIGILSESSQPRTLGFGDEIEYGDAVFTVWKWQPIRRWIAQRDEDIAQLLKLHNMREIFSVQLKASGAFVVERFTFPGYLGPPDGVLPPGTSWTFFVVLFFLVLRNSNDALAD